MEDRKRGNRPRSESEQRCPQRMKGRRQARRKQRVEPLEESRVYKTRGNLGGADENARQQGLGWRCASRAEKPRQMGRHRCEIVQPAAKAKARSHMVIEGHRRFGHVFSGG